MTTEEKAKAYDEALERAKAYHRNELAGSRKEMMEYIFPELRESEDERIRKELIEFIKWSVDRHFMREDFHQAKRPSEWIAYLEKQKEHNGEDEECTDFTIYHPLKNGKGKYECIPYSFHGSLTSFSEDKDLIDFLRTCFYTKEECEEWIEKQKEQKPAKWSEEDEFFRQQLIVYCEKCVQDTLAAKCVDWLKSLRPQPKQEVTDEEIEKMVINRSRSSGTTKSEVAFYRNGIKDAIKRFGLRPSWKPSEEQISSLKQARDYYMSGRIKYVGRHLSEIAEQLEKLM